MRNIAQDKNANSLYSKKGMPQLNDDLNFCGNRFNILQIFWKHLSISRIKNSMKKNLTCRQHVRHGKEIAYNIENDPITI